MSTVCQKVETVTVRSVAIEIAWRTDGLHYVAGKRHAVLNDSTGAELETIEVASVGQHPLVDRLR